MPAQSPPTTAGSRRSCPAGHTQQAARRLPSWCAWAGQPWSWARWLLPVLPGRPRGTGRSCCPCALCRLIWPPCARFWPLYGPPGVHTPGCQHVGCRGCRQLGCCQSCCAVEAVRRRTLSGDVRDTAASGLVKCLTEGRSDSRAAGIPMLGRATRASWLASGHVRGLHRARCELLNPGML